MLVSCVVICLRPIYCIVACMHVCYRVVCLSAGDCSSACVPQTKGQRVEDIYCSCSLKMASPKTKVIRRIVHTSEAPEALGPYR